MTDLKTLPAAAIAFVAKVKGEHRTRVACPACGKAFLVKANGVIAKHGYRVHWGMQNGQCFGSNRSPMRAYETTLEGLTSWIESREAKLAELERRLPAEADDAAAFDEWWDAQPQEQRRQWVSRGYLGSILWHAVPEDAPGRDIAKLISDVGGNNQSRPMLAFYREQYPDDSDARLFSAVKGNQYELNSTKRHRDKLLNKRDAYEGASEFVAAVAALNDEE